MIPLYPCPDTRSIVNAVGETIPSTNAWRILHDIAQGVWVDHFDGRWLVQTRDDHFPTELLERAEGVARAVYWRPRDKSAGSVPLWQWGEKVEEPFVVRENGASFRIDFQAGYSTGLFLDQRLNRQRVYEASVPGRRILNTFAYTGAFSVMAALGGAVTTTSDLSKSYLDWSWENFRLNHLDPEAHFGIKGDTRDWMRVFERKGRTFHGIVLDPPTFSRQAKATFGTEKDYRDLVTRAASILEPGGWLLCCSNTHKWSLSAFEYEVLNGLGDAGREAVSVEDQPLPPEFRGDDYLKSLWVVVG